MPSKPYLKIQPQAYESELLKVADILYKLRTHSKNWQTHFGHENKYLMQKQEAKADEWIKENIILIEQHQKLNL